jgi:hypothetical protein
MIKLKTEVDLPLFRKKMGYRHPSMMIGSCFAENIGDQLHERCLPTTVNPFGILYNPVSIANSLAILLENKEFTSQDLFFHENLYHSFAHHGKFSRPDQQEMLDLINAKTIEASKVLKNCSHLFITFGTSWVFRHKESGKVVSNCHKLPGTLFDQYRLQVAQITEIWIPLLQQLFKLNPNLHIVFTVSPIRHLKDGAHNNQLSKSVLLLAIDDLSTHFGSELISYFPAYEQLLDELRDYRFYASDLTHPSDVAIEMIREKFETSFFDQEAKSISSEVIKLVEATRHRPQNFNNIGFQSFIMKNIEIAHQIQNKYPFIDVERIVNNLNEKIGILFSD